MHESISFLVNNICPITITIFTACIIPWYFPMFHYEYWSLGSILICISNIVIFMNSISIMNIIWWNQCPHFERFWICTIWTTSRTKYNKSSIFLKRKKRIIIIKNSIYFEFYLFLNFFWIDTNIGAHLYITTIVKINCILSTIWIYNDLYSIFKYNLNFIFSNFTSI